MTRSRVAGKRPRVASGGGAQALVLRGLTGGFTGIGNVPTTANPGGIAGVDTGFFVAALFRLVAAPSSSNRAIAGRSNNSNAGWWLFAGATYNQIFGRVWNGVGSAVSSPSYTITGSDRSNVMGAVLVHTGTHVRLYVNRVEVGSGTAITGYTPHSGAMQIGANGADAWGFSDFSAQGQIFGVTAGAGVPSLANVQTWFDNCKSGYTCATMPTVGSQYRWLCTSTTSPIVDDVGASDASYTPSGMSLIADAAPTWGW